MRWAFVAGALGVGLAWGSGCGDDGGGVDGGPDAADDASLGDGALDGAAPDTASPVVTLPDEREPCADRDPERRPFFGDLHVHTRFSFDAAAWGVRASPDDAYRFAKGEALGLPPYDADGNSTRRVTIRRPLDFAAVTDHAEFFAETALCHDPSSPAYDSSTCQSYRGGDADFLDFGELAATFLMADPLPPRYCREEPEICRAQAGAAWEEMQDAAEAHYDRSSACTFTTFVAWEWSGATPGVTNVHRNVIFRNRTVPRVPVSFIDAPTPDALWGALDARCTDTGTPCDVVAIPHNSNVGGGHMFNPITEDGAPYGREDAERRARLEPLVEIYQHKGASECAFGVPHPLASEDELCAFEVLQPGECTGDPSDPADCVPVCSSLGSSGGFIGGCHQPSDLLRPALRTGLVELSRVGVNPFRFGFIGSTDTHNAAAGHVSEDGWEGHVGTRDGDAASRLRPKDGVLVGMNRNSPGGLAVLWAEENSRDALFDAMERREAYATSGTRMVVRFFGGWSYAASLCDQADLVSVGYADGVPMGGILPAPAATPDAPRFVISALRDPGATGFAGTDLAAVQIVKGWLEGGETFERVYDVAGDLDRGADVDRATCAPTGTGAASLCTVWTDPEFDPAVPAFYYARVLENPTCRWSHRLCLALDVDCASVGAGDPLAACCDASLPETLRERAWTSPIWYEP